LGFDAFVCQLNTPSQNVRSNANAEIDIGVANERFMIPAGNGQTTQLPSIQGDPTAVASFEIMLRRPLLTTSQFPQGRLQPQLTVAPALLFTDTDFSATVGVKVGAGLAWQFHPHIALFVEYRFTHFQLDVRDSALLVEGLIIRNPDVEIDLNTHHIIAGISRRL
jgi:opacity protein-like surface antigen